MRSGIMLAAGLLLALPAAAEPARPKLEDLKWLAGCWMENGGEPGSVELWLPPAGGSMLGVSRTIIKGKMIAWETMQIKQQDDGAIDYIAKPNNQGGASFRLISADAKALTFENPTHDFPQRIIYKLAGDGSLQARIEGTLKGKPESEDYPMKRVACE